MFGESDHRGASLAIIALRAMIRPPLKDRDAVSILESPSGEQEALDARTQSWHSLARPLCDLRA